VPERRQDVMVLGEVQSASSHFQPDLSGRIYRSERRRHAPGRSQQHLRVRADGARDQPSALADRASGVDIHREMPSSCLSIPTVCGCPMWQSITQFSTTRRSRQRRYIRLKGRTQRPFMPGVSDWIGSSVYCLAFFFLPTLMLALATWRGAANSSCNVVGLMDCQRFPEVSSLGA